MMEEEQIDVEVLVERLRRASTTRDGAGIPNGTQHLCAEAVAIILSLQSRLGQYVDRAERAEKDLRANRQWVAKAKREAGYPDSASFDDVWREVLAERVDADVLQVLRDIASVDQGFVDTNGGAQAALERVVAHADDALTKVAT